MKWVFYVMVFVYMFYRAVYGKAAESTLLANIDDIVTSGENSFFNVKDDITMSCKSTNKNVEMEWIDPKGDVVTRETDNRVFVQDHLRGRSSTLVLTITGAEVEDSGIYMCHSGDLMKNVSLCVFDPVEFVDPTTTVTMDLGRSVTISCPTKGDPEPNFSWHKNSEPITDEDGSKYRMNTQYTMEGHYDGQLTLISLEPEDSGVYACIASQKSSHDNDCSKENSLYFTLNVRHKPIFDENDTLVYTQSNRDVELRCAANGYPAPAYKWFKEERDVSYRQVGKLELSVGKNGSVLVVNPGSTFGQKYKCEASNKFGSAIKYFTLEKIGQPNKPSTVTISNATANAIELTVMWDDETKFPVDSFQLRYIKSLSTKKPKETAWWKSGLAEYILEEELSDFNGVTVTLGSLEEDTNYWVRLRAVNTAGTSAWSDPVSASTGTNVEESATEEPAEDPLPAKEQINKSDATTYGIFFAGGILVVAVVCMFAMRMVK